jgi:hypothetical protein
LPTLFPISPVDGAIPPSIAASSSTDSAHFPSLAPIGKTVISTASTLYDKIRDEHVLDAQGALSLIYIDRCLVHEVMNEALA